LCAGITEPDVEMEAVLFIGIQAVGKSSFYKERFFTTHVRINLDMLRTRHRERVLLHACIEAKQSFVVDNTNLTVQDRARYIALAKPAGFQIVGYYFKSQLADAIRRNEARPAEAQVPPKGILSAYGRLEIPSPDEGFDALFYVSIDANGDFVVQGWVDEV
jgi:predicted kinase